MKEGMMIEWKNVALMDVYNLISTGQEYDIHSILGSHFCCLLVCTHFLSS